jgi:hypothetical protein
MLDLPTKNKNKLTLIWWTILFKVYYVTHEDFSFSSVDEIKMNLLDNPTERKLVDVLVLQFPPSRSFFV